MNWWYFMIFEFFYGSDAGEKEQLRGIEGTC